MQSKQIWCVWSYRRLIELRSWGFTTTNRALWDFSMHRLCIFVYKLLKSERLIITITVLDVLRSWTIIDIVVRVIFLEIAYYT